MTCRAFRPDASRRSETGAGVYRSRVIGVKRRSGDPCNPAGTSRGLRQPAPRASPGVRAQPLDLRLALPELEIDCGILGLGVAQVARELNQARSGPPPRQDLDVLARFHQVVVGAGLERQ